MGAGYPESLNFTSKYVSITGHDIHYLETGPISKVTYVFVHGNPTSAYTFRKLLELFGQKSHCIALDLPGFGNSKSKTLINPNVLVQAFFDFVVQLKLENIVLVTHEWGGIISIAAAIQDMSRYKRIVVLNGITDPVMKFGMSYKLSMRSAAGVFKNKIIKGMFNTLKDEELAIYQSLFDNTSPELIENMEKYIPTSKSDPYHALVLNTLSKFESWDLSTKIIFGNADKYFTAKNAEELANKMARTRLHIVEDAGHLVHEDKPQEVFSIISTW